MFNAEKLRSPQFIFIIYMAVFIILIMILRFVFPGSDDPLPIYSFNWRIIQGLLEVFNLFPALALSALVIPFGLASFEENYNSFSDLFFKRLSVSVVIAICAAVIYGIIFFLVTPMLKNYEENMRYSGELYKLAKKRAIESKDAGEWYDASQFLSICEYIWHDSKELEALKDETIINLEKQLSDEQKERVMSRAVLTRELRSPEIWPISEDYRPVNAAEAIAMSREAFDKERYFDAHWLANLGNRLAGRNSVEAGYAARLANEAWDKISSLEPTDRESRIYELYEMKLSGYRAMEIDDWIRAYYIFLHLSALTPDDPDVKNYFAASEQGAKEIAFFIDEMELALGEILNGAVFSLPKEEERVVLRFSSLTATEDIAYGIGFEYMHFDANMHPAAAASSRYAKLVPITLDKPMILVLTLALDRYNEDGSFQSEWHLGSPPVGGILLDISFEDLMLISNVRRGLGNLQINELFAAADKLGESGYIAHVFHAEILNRIGSALFFLPIAIFVIILAWRYRAKQRPRYLFFLLLPILPVVFHGFVYLYRSVINSSAIWLVLNVGFSVSLAVYIGVLAVSLFISLISLAGQHT